MAINSLISEFESCVVERSAVGITVPSIFCFLALHSPLNIETIYKDIKKT